MYAIFLNHRMLFYADLLEVRIVLFLLPLFPVSKPSDNTAESKLLNLSLVLAAMNVTRLWNF